MNVDEIVDGVIGKRSSYVAGLGYGPKPKKTTRILEEALKEKEKENTALKENVKTMETTLEEHGRLLQRLLGSQQHPSSSSSW